MPRQDHKPRPNLKVKIVFEQVDTDDESVKGCKIYLEQPHRDITEEVLMGEDRTIAECWSAEVFEQIRQQLQLKTLAEGGYFGAHPRKKEMN